MSQRRAGQKRNRTVKVELLNESCRAVKLLIWLHAVDEDRSANDANLPPGENVEDCEKRRESARCWRGLEPDQTNVRVDFPAPLAPIKAQTRPGLM